ncbi:septation protein SpoVG family protein [Candidatus Berkelbacteria bacterium]|nr:septation protein SpoVG family protein [Candidatus Berkelbacteria bacterium]
MKLSEIEIIPVKPQGGLVAFASLVVNDSIYLGSIGIHQRLSGGYRVVYPTKKVGVRDVSIFHPINRMTGKLIETAIVEKCEELFEKSDERNDRYSKARGQVR